MLYVKEIVALANSSGGYLLLGVEDNKEITGLLPAPGENSGTPDTGADPQGPCASSLHPCRNAGKFSGLSGRTDRRSGDGTFEDLVPPA